MAKYCVNKNAQANGDHEVHREGCIFWPLATNQLDLGDHMTCTTAVTKAKQSYARSNGCATCSPVCHTS